MAKLSVIIPARHELYLQQTVTDLLTKAGGDIEIIVVLDGYWPDPIIQDDPRVALLHREKRGMRNSINAGVSISKGEFIMKVDAHCAFAPGYDERLKANCGDNWVVTPRRYSLNPDTWQIKPERPFYDYDALLRPGRSERSVHGVFALDSSPWLERTRERINLQVDENLAFQGSCWFMKKSWFKPLDLSLGSWGGEATEICLRTWYEGGKVMTNKTTWYAHLWKGKGYREKYKTEKGTAYERDKQIERNDVIDDRLLRLIERFKPVPTWTTM